MVYGLCLLGDNVFAIECIPRSTHVQVESLGTAEPGEQTRTTFRFQNFLGEDGSRPPYKLAPHTLFQNGYHFNIFC